VLCDSFRYLFLKEEVTGEGINSSWDEDDGEYVSLIPREKNELKTRLSMMERDRILP
jgi:hypothetical protein